VLAGGNADPRLAPGLPNKAFLTIGGRPLVVNVVDALRGSPSVARIIVAGPRALEGIFQGEIQVIATDGPQWENILAALALVRSADLVLAIASDLPLVQSTTIEALVRECSGGAAFYYPFVSRAAIEKQLENLDQQFNQVIESGLPEASRAYLGMSGFKVRINVHGDLLEIKQPGRIAPEDE